jgi:bifunctional ADP-heptose synthase (sugar kinase/adenylyltransferase)
VDTRNKILTAEAAAALQPARPLALVTGYFDVLRAAHIHELGELRRRTGAATLLAVVLPLARELLSQPARAELVAALRMVDYVVPTDLAGVDRLRASLQPIELARLENADAKRARDLIARVKSAAGSREP